MDSMQSSASFLGLGLYVLAFRWVFFWSKPNMPMTWSKIEPGHTKGDNELSSMMFDKTELVH
jgi:hypothetical protein